MAENKGRDIVTSVYTLDWVVIGIVFVPTGVFVWQDSEGSELKSTALSGPPA